MTDLISPEFVILELQATDKDDAARELATLLAASGRVTDLEGFLADIKKREEQMATGIEGGIGLPHCRSTHATVPSLAFGRSTAGIDFGAPDGPAHLVFLIAAPEGGDSDHLKILAALARRLVRQTFKDTLHNATSAQEVADYITQEVTV